MTITGNHQPCCPATSKEDDTRHPSHGSHYGGGEGEEDPHGILLHGVYLVMQEVWGAVRLCHWALPNMCVIEWRQSYTFSWNNGTVDYLRLVFDSRRVGSQAECHGHQSHWSSCYVVVTTFHHHQTLPNWAVFFPQLALWQHSTIVYLYVIMYSL